MDRVDMYLRDEESNYEKYLRALPECCECGDKIEDDELVDIDGDLYCIECARKLFVQPTENYMDWERGR